MYEKEINTLRSINEIFQIQESKITVLNVSRMVKDIQDFFVIILLHSTFCVIISFFSKYQFKLLGDILTKFEKYQISELSHR